MQAGQPKDSKNLWGGRFEGGADRGFAEFNQSLSFDRRLWEADIQGSIAHCDGLVRAQVLTTDEGQQIKGGLAAILKAARSDSAYLEELSSEDVHSFVEARLVQMIGEAGRKLHAGRSSNAQVATDLRIWLREQIDLTIESLRNAQEALLDLGEAQANVVIPGYTHLQRAQPIL